MSGRIIIYCIWVCTSKIQVPKYPLYGAPPDNTIAPVESSTPRKPLCQVPPSQETITQPSGIHIESEPELPLDKVVVKKIDPVESAKVKLLPFLHLQMNHTY